MFTKGRTTRRTAIHSVQTPIQLNGHEPATPEQEPPAKTKAKASLKHSPLNDQKNNEAQLLSTPTNAGEPLTPRRMTRSATRALEKNIAEAKLQSAATPVAQVNDSDERDSVYEFQAPKFYDFLNENNNAIGDEWFDMRAGSPGADLLNEIAEVSQSNKKSKLSAKATRKRVAFASPIADYSRRSSANSLPRFEIIDSTSDYNSVNMESSNPATQTITSDQFREKNPFAKYHSTEETEPPRKSVKAVKPIKEKLAAKYNLPVPRIRSQKTPTIPKEFEFSTLSSSRKNTASKDSVKLRSGGIEKKVPKRKPRELTIPQEFNFTSSKSNPTKSKVEKPSVPASPYVPLAVKLKKFEEGTPARFRTRPAKVEKSQKTTLTQPKSPFLMTKTRVKNEHIPTTEERELEEIEKYKFTAQPFEDHVNHNLGVRFVKPHPPTIPKSPAITKPKPKPAPEPESPVIIKANPIRQLPMFEPVHEHKYTIPEDVHLPGETISERKKREFEEKLLREQEEKERMRKFRAQPLPSDEPDPLPAVPERPLTMPKPFNFSEHQGEIHQKNLEELLREKELKENPIEFKANPVPAVAPFFPKKSMKQPTQPEDIELATEIQAEKRKQFDEMIRQQEEHDKMLREQQEREKEEREKEEAMKLRKLQVHKAQPIKHFAPVIVQPSSKKPTVPQSPMIGEKRKRMLRQRSKSSLANHSEDYDE